MSIFWRLTKQDYYFTAIELKKIIPELKHCDTGHITSHLRGSNMEFYYLEQIKTPFWIRLTLPFGLLTMLILLIISPINYIISGHWGYKVQWLSNYFRSLGF